MDDHKVSHLEMIQGVINRMAGNSFALKGWAVTLVAGIFALSSKDSDRTYFIVAYIPIIVFWFLDSYYLLQERLFRSLYEDATNANSTVTNFSMNIAPYKKNWHCCGEKNSFTNCLMSKTEAGFYIPLALVSGIVIILSSL